jgi:hypothetical protein
MTKKKRVPLRYKCKRHPTYKALEFPWKTGCHSCILLFDLRSHIEGDEEYEIEPRIAEVKSAR